MEFGEKWLPEQLLNFGEGWFADQVLTNGWDSGQYDTDWQRMDVEFSVVFEGPYYTPDVPTYYPVTPSVTRRYGRAGE